MKKTLLTCFVATATLAMQAQSLKYLTFKTRSGTEKSMSVKGLKMVFTGGNLVATNKETSLTLPLTDMSDMTFTAVPTAIEAVGAGTDLVKVNGNSLCVTARKGTAVHIYTADGRLITGFTANGNPEEMSLQSGVYLVSINGKTFKIVVK